MKSDCVGEKVSPYGLFSAVDGLPELSLEHWPTAVLYVARFAIWRTQLLPVSAMKRSPMALIARPEGALSTTLPVMPEQTFGTRVEGVPAITQGLAFGT